MDNSTSSGNTLLIFYAAYHSFSQLLGKGKLLKEIVSFKTLFVIKTANCLFWLSFDFIVSTLEDSLPGQHPLNTHRSMPGALLWAGNRKFFILGLSQCTSRETEMWATVTTQCAKLCTRGLYKGLWETRGYTLTQSRQAFPKMRGWNFQDKDQHEERHGKGKK